MANPASAKELFDALMADTTFVDYLGTYTFADGSSSPSIAAFMANQSTPPGTQTEGVEVVISQELEQKSIPFITGNARVEQTWRLYCTQYQTTDQFFLHEAVERILSHLPGAESVPVNVPGGPADVIGALGQVVVTWTNPESAVCTAPSL